MVKRARVEPAAPAEPTHYVTLTWRTLHGGCEFFEARVYLKVSGEKIRDYMRTMTFSVCDAALDVCDEGDGADLMNVYDSPLYEPGVILGIDEEFRQVRVSVYDKVLTDADLNRVKACKTDIMVLSIYEALAWEWQPFDWDRLFA